MQIVRQVLQRLLESGLHFKSEKCEFHRSTVSFLDYVITEGNIQMDECKVMAVKEWPTPSSRKDVQRFLGFANCYWKFIRNFSQIAAPLHTPTSSRFPFFWSSQAETAFQRLKNCFTAAPVEVDASNTGVVLSDTFFLEVIS